MQRSLYQKVGIASLIMMGSVFLSRVIGLFREMTIAWMGGAGADVDAYQIGFVIPEILNHIVASGFLSVTFIPIFSRYLAEGREDEGWRAFSVIMTTFGLILGVLIFLSWMFAPELVALLAPGLNDSAVRDAAVRMTRIIIPAQFFFFTGGLFMAVQFAKERFFIPALAPLLYNLGIIAGGLLLGRCLGMEGFAWGVLIGAFVGNFLVQAIGAKRLRMRFQLRISFRDPDLIAYVLLTLPLILGLTMTFSTEVFLKFFGSFMPEGAVASLNYGLRVMLILVGVFGQAAGVASFPFLARLYAEGRMDEMNRLLNHSVRYLALVIPIAALVMVLRNEVVLILFQRGRFDAAATGRTADLLVFLMIGAFAFASQTVVVRGFYAMRDTLFPAILGTVAVLLSLPIYWFGMNILGTRGIALAISFSAFLQVFMLYTIWNRRTGNMESRSVYRFIGIITGLSVPLGFLLEWLRRILTEMIDASTPVGSLLTMLILFMVFFPLAGILARLLNIEEVFVLWRKIVNRVKRRKPAG